MRKNKLTELQIVEVLQKAETGYPIETLCSDYQISLTTFYQWKKKYSQLNEHHLKKINALTHRNRQLNRLYMRCLQQNEILQRAIEGKL